jgi:hypothetical protein
VIVTSAVAVANFAASNGLNVTASVWASPIGGIVPATGA